MPCTLDDSSHSGGKTRSSSLGEQEGAGTKEQLEQFSPDFLDGGMGDGSQQKKMPS